MSGFVPTDWQDGEAGGTPITAAELHKLNDGIVEAATTAGSVSDAGGLIVVTHGADAAHGRPDVSGPVLWIGSVTPNNMVDGDLLQVYTASGPDTAPTITTTSLPAMTQGTAISSTQIAATGTAPITYAVTAGTLPAGLALSSSGVFTGTPSGSGAYDFTVTATNSAGTDTQQYTGTITASGGGGAAVGFTATGGNGPASVASHSVAVAAAAHDTVIAAVNAASAATISSIKFGGVDMVLVDTQGQGGSGHGDLWVYKAVDVAGPGNVDVALSTTVASDVAAAAYPNVGSISAVQKTSGSNNTALAQAATGVTNGRAVQVFSTSGWNQTSPTGGTVRQNRGSSVSPSLVLMDAATVGAINFAATAASSTFWAAINLILNPA